jgi:hypothetical protein
MFKYFIKIIKLIKNKIFRIEFSYNHFNYYEGEVLNNRKKILINFAEKNFYNSQLKNSLTGLMSGFNIIYQFSMKDIDKEFYKKNILIFSELRGAGYWLWKPYIVNKTLASMNENDILFYSDSGAFFIKNLNYLFEKVINDENGVIAFSLAGKHIEKIWTKRDLFIKMDMNQPQFTNTPQIMASFFLLRGTNFAKNLFSEYLEIAQNKNLIDDSLNFDKFVDTEFIEHRHDQSIWSLLVKKYYITILPDPTQWGLFHKESNLDDQFIYHSRNKV